MKIVHVNCSSGGGGAAIAAYRHMEAMRQAGIDASMLVLENAINTPNTIIYRPGARESLIHLCYKIFSSINYKMASPRLVWNSSYAGYDISDCPEVQGADIIYLHWVAGFVSYRGLRRLLKTGKIIVLYLHDMEGLTGGCHYSLDCKLYTEHCQTCLALGGLKSLSYHNLKYKLDKISGFDNLVVASPSIWLSDCAKKSTLFKCSKNVVVRNVLNTKVYKPRPKKESRLKLGLNPYKKYLLFVACDVNSVFKGWIYLEKALNNIHDENVEALVLGNFDANNHLAGIKINALGFVNDESRKIDIYSAADVLVIPSVAENFPNVVIEAMACGTPVVGFDTGGIRDQIKHLSNGYLAENKSSESLLQGIKWIFGLPENEYEKISEEAVAYVEKACSYESVLANHNIIFEL